MYVLFDVERYKKFVHFEIQNDPEATCQPANKVTFEPSPNSWSMQKQTTILKTKCII